MDVNANGLANSFVYAPLEQATTIRVLELCPGVEDEPLRGSLKHVDIMFDNTKFDAVSYVWGHPVLYDRPLTTPSGILYITASLEEVLKRIRPPHETLTVWSDGACVNQHDVQERGHQVKLMGRIYGSARQVLIWLGPDPANIAEKVFHYLFVVSQEKCFFPGQGGLEEKDWPMYNHIMELLHCRWVSRLWVVQEALLAGRTRVIWGSRETEFTLLAGKIYDLLIFNSRSGICFPARIPFHHLQWIQSFDISGTYSIFEILSMTRSLLCSDPRDHIYAVLGLSYEEPKSEALRNTIEPNYNMKAKDLYIDFARKAVHCGFLCEVLDAVHHGSTLERGGKAGIPSWVPRWDGDNASRLTKLLKSRGIFRMPEETTGGPFFFDNNRILVIGAYHVGHVREVQGQTLLLDAWNINIRSIYQFCLENILEIGFTAMEKVLLTRSLGLALCGEDTWIEDGDSANVLEVFRNQMNAAVVDIKPPNAFVKFIKTICKDLRGVNVVTWDTMIGGIIHNETTEEDEDEISKSKGNIGNNDRNGNSGSDGDEDDGDLGPAWTGYPQQVLMGRKLFIMNVFSFGLGPEAMQAGDEIVMLDGHPFPFVLRKDDDMYQFVGAAYFGMPARSKMIRKLRTQGSKPAIFKIR